jgi:hypothetical protein
MVLTGARGGAPVGRVTSRGVPVIFGKPDQTGVNRSKSEANNTMNPEPSIRFPSKLSLSLFPYVKSFPQSFPNRFVSGSAPFRPHPLRQAWRGPFTQTVKRRISLSLSTCQGSTRLDKPLKKPLHQALTSRHYYHPAITTRPFVSIRG